MSGHNSEVARRVRSFAFSSIRDRSFTKCHGRKSCVSTPTSIESAAGSSGSRPCEWPSRCQDPRNEWCHHRNRFQV